MAGFMDRIKAALAAFRTNEAPSSSGSSSNGSAAKRNPNEVVVKRMGLAADFNREAQGPTDFDLTEITNAYDRESLVRQAIDRYVELIFKAGWDLTSKNQAAVDYVRTRLRFMAEVTQIPTEQLLIEIAEDLVLYSNAIVLKARAKDPSQLPPGLSIAGLGGQPPIAGYFPADVTTFKNVRDKNGTVIRWEQEVEGQDTTLRFQPSEVIHFYYKRRKGKAWGTPFLVPVLDDIRALRQAEEHVLRLIYRNLFPFYHYQVGRPEPGFEGTDEEVQEVQEAIENMDLEAGIVTTERHNIKSIAANQIIDAMPYLRYFWERVVMGLGVPETLLGKSSTSNRATADQLSVEMRDRIKAIQKVLATFIDQFIIDELLLEGGFDPTLNPDDDVEFTFREIDTDGLIKIQNHAVLMYQSNAINEDEMRQMIGRDPITDRSKMFINLVTLPTALAGKSDTANQQNQSAQNTTKSRQQPTNQYGTKPSPKKSASAGREPEPAETLHEALTDLYESMVRAVAALIEKAYDDPASKESVQAELATTILKHGEDMGSCLADCVQTEETRVLVDALVRRLLQQIDAAALSLVSEVVQSKAWALDSFQTTATVLADRIDLIVAKVYPEAEQEDPV